MSDSATRKRSRVACTSCQSRKRKCSGGQPCTICAQFGVECHYDFFSRKKKDVKPAPYSAVCQSTTANPGDLSTTSADERNCSPGGSDHTLHVSSLEANSGAAFVRRLGLRIDSAHAPRLHLFAWNVGVRAMAPSSPPSVAPPAASVVDIISQEEMRSLITVWYERIDPCYGFIDRDHLLRQVSRRWLPPSSESHLGYSHYDAVLCGIAAMGIVFSRRKATIAEAHLVETNRLILDENLHSESPSIDLVTGWVLRVSYLRMTASPHVTWLASCTLMHLIEAAGLHLELPSDTGILRPSNDENYHGNPEIRRRLFWMGRHLNVWVSFELGRSRVVLHGATSLPPAPRTDVNSTEVFELLPTSESLDPTKSQDSGDLETTLSDVLDGHYVQLPLILTQCNLALCIYRRLRALNSLISAKLLDRVVAVAANALRASRELNANVCPWHQIANVPFQIVCTLLAMDNRASLTLLGDAMQTLREVAAAYDTDVMREAYSTAYLLILLHQRRKEEDTRAIGDVLRVNSVASFLPPHQDSTNNTTATATATAAGDDSHGEPGAAAVPSSPNTSFNHDNITASHDAAILNHSEFSWLGDLMIDMPSLQNFDLDQFLTTDVPWPLPEMGI